jgi:hypothetical protein
VSATKYNYIFHYIMSIVGFITYDGLDQPVYWADALAAPIKLKTVVPEFPLPIIGGRALGINNSGNIVGALFGDSEGFVVPVYWTGYSASPTLLKNIDGTPTVGVAFGINNLGAIVGTVFGGISVAVYWDDYLTESKPLKSRGLFTTNATGINDSGEIVGVCAAESNTPPVVYWKDSSDEPIVLNKGGFEYVYIQGINNSGEIIGYSTDRFGERYRSIYWENFSDVPKLLNLNGSGFANGFNNSREFVGYINTNDDLELPVPTYWLNSTAVPIALEFTGGSGGQAYGISDPGPAPGPTTPTPSPTPTPLISNICFPAGTEITTDQGIIAIEKLIPGKHTLQGKPIEYITHTVTTCPYLIKVHAHAFGKNKPTKPLLLTKDHKIEYEGKLVPAYQLLDCSTAVTKARYTGEVLYNVLLATYSTMRVNNLRCETLDPRSPIACKYQGFAYEGEQNTEKRNTEKRNTLVKN